MTDDNEDRKTGFDLSEAFRNRIRAHNAVHGAKLPAEQKAVRDRCEIVQARSDNRSLLNIDKN